MIKHDKENKDYQMLIDGYDEPVERAIARELFKLDQDQLRALLEDKIEMNELVEWHEGTLSETDLEERISEDKEWVVEQIILHKDNTLAYELGVKSERRYLTVEIWGYDLHSFADLDVEVKYSEGSEENLPTDVIEMTDERGNNV